MNFESTDLEGLYLIKPDCQSDEAIAFFETTSLNDLEGTQSAASYLHENQLKAQFGTIRGLHYQLAPFAHHKIVRVGVGEIVDVAVDIRKGSPTFGQWRSFILNETNNFRLSIPVGFAHGFSVLSKKAKIIIKTDKPFKPEMQKGFIYNDEKLGIDWKLKENQMKIPVKDRVLPSFDHAEMNFIYS